MRTDRPTIVLQGALPSRWDSEGDRAVLVLHGYTGYCGEMYQLARHLAERGYAVDLPRLPGHGTNRADFLSSNHRDWLRRAVDSYLELSSRYTRVSVVGLSMGAVLASILAAEFPVERLVLLAPALLTRSNVLWLTPLMRWFVGPYSKGPVEQYPDDPERAYLAAEYWNYQWPSQLASLWKLMRRGRSGLPRISAPTLVIAGGNDGVIPTTVVDFIFASLGAQTRRGVVIGDASHVITRAEWLPQVLAEVVPWLEAENETDLAALETSR